MSATASPCLDHFIDLCYQGRRSGCSTYERFSRELAQAVLDKVPGMDGQAVEGLCEFIHLAAAAPDTARRVIG
jgi:hypothetical protein